MAVVLGVDQYSEPIPRLHSAVSDASAVALALAAEHGFEVTALYDAAVTCTNLRTLLGATLPSHLTADDRLLFYFAGHGVAHEADDGPAGYVLLHDSVGSDAATFLPMRELHDALAKLPCRHCLVILDCCFAGAFRWSTLRNFIVTPKLYRERYERFVASQAWQVLTSASSEQFALDSLHTGRGECEPTRSPFAAALLAGLAGAADFSRDGLITASELALYLRDRVETAVERAGSAQTPQLFLLNQHEHGEFVFRAPHREIELAPAPLLTPDLNPYRGLGSYDEREAPTFFGRARASAELLKAVEERSLTVVVGTSGTGKSSLVKAGLFPALRALGTYELVAPERPGREPLAMMRRLADAVAGAATPPEIPSARALLAALAQRRDARPIVVVIDQFEELLAAGSEIDCGTVVQALAGALAQEPRLRLVLTVRSDVEPRFHGGPLGDRWRDARVPISPLTRAELRDGLDPFPWTPSYAAFTRCTNSCSKSIGLRY